MNDTLLTKYLLKETNDQEESVVRNWIDASPQNSRYYNQLRQIWEASRTFVETSDVDEEKAWQRFLQRRGQLVEPAVKRPSGIVKRMRWLSVAAALVVVSFAVLIGYFLLTQQREQLHASVYETTVDVRTDTLADGSIVTLNSHAAMRFSQGGLQSERRVELQRGEVFFSVAPNRKRPFVIQSGQVTVTVLGTAFHVRHTTVNETEVIVEHGLVRVEGLGKTLELRPGQKVSINTLTQRFDEGKVQDQLHNYYVSNRFELDNTPLWRVAEVLEAAYGVSIEIERDEIRDLPLTTTFPKGALKANLHIISEALGITVVQRGDQILFK